MDAVRDKDFFEELGLKVAHGEVEIGQTYPIFGMITEILDETPGNVLVQINHNIKAKIFLEDPEKLEVLKSRAFESGVFVATVTAKEPSVEIICRTIIFGKPQAHQA